MTWRILGDDTTLQNIVGLFSPSDWKDYFRTNEDNITQDLLSILKIVDKVAGSISDPQFNLTFKDANGDVIGNQLVINPKVSGDYKFQLGRVIELKIGSDSNPAAVKFNTVNAQVDETKTIPTSQIKFQLGSQDITSVEAVTGMPNQTVSIPEGSIDFKLNDRVFGSVAVASNNGHVEVKIPQDVNLVPAALADQTQYVSSSSGTYTIKLNPNIHIYRMDANSDFTLKIDADKYKSASDLGFQVTNKVIEFEVHVTNTSSNTINATNITDQGFDSQGGLHSSWISNLPNPMIQTFRYLNDKTTVEAGETAVYVFRIDTDRCSMVWSLAYEY